MDENSLEPCDPTVADVGCRKSNVANQLPSYDTHNAVCFAWPATTLAAMRYASRLIERTISIENTGVKRSWMPRNPCLAGFLDQGPVGAVCDKSRVNYCYNSFVIQGLLWV